MKLLLSRSLGCALGLFSALSSANATTITADSPSFADVSAAVALAANGDTVQIPAGSATWSSTLSINKPLILQGAGSSATVITSSLSSGASLITLSPSSDLSIRLTAIGFQLGTMNGGKRAITVLGNRANAFALTKVRLDHLAITGGGGNSGTIQTDGWVNACIDHNTFTNTYSAVYARGDDNQAWTRAQNNGAVAAGTADALFIEDNSFILNASSVVTVDAEVYVQEGANVVVRYNTFDSTAFTAVNFLTLMFNNHGNQEYINGTLGTNFRGSPIFEAYNNTAHGHIVNGTFMGIRGGSVLIHDNTMTTVTGSAVPIQFSEEEDWQTAFFSPLRTAWPAQDQMFNSFVWNNTYNGSPITDVVLDEPATDATFIQQARDYFMHAPQSSGGKETFTGTRWGGSTTAPTTSDTGSMTFSSFGANAYFPYTPYTYPHPLVSSSPKPLPSGIIDLPAKPPSGIVDLTGNPILDMPYIDGVRLKFGWSTIQPDNADEFNWEPIDSQIAIAAANGKFLGISISAGFYVPTWAYTGSPALYRFFIDPADSGENDGEFLQASEPCPWDVNFLAKWITFVNAFGARYDGNPTIRYVVMCGMQQFNQLYYIRNADASPMFTDGLTTGSTNLHSATANFVVGDVTHGVSGTNIQKGTTITARVNATDVTLSKTTTAGSGATFFIWQRVAGSDDGDDFKVNELAKHHPTGAAGSWSDYSDVDPVSGHLRHAGIAAWLDGSKQIIDAYHTAFPTTELIISAAKPFPATNEYASDAGDEVKEYGELAYPPLFGDMGTGLQAAPEPPPPTPTPIPRTAHFGQQALHESTAADMYASPAPSPTPAPPQPLIDLLYNGYHKGVEWMEIYEKDCQNTNPLAVAGLTKYHNLLVGATPTPTPPNGRIFLRFLP